jgi:hypothetical protein
MCRQSIVAFLFSVFSLSESAQAADCAIKGASKEFMIRMADAMQGVIAADRAVYAKEVVTRLDNELNVIKALEHWKDEKKALPLPAQMLRMSSENFSKKNKDISFALLSLWPLNKQNAAKTPAEKAGLAAVAKDPKKNFYDCEKLGKKTYFTAIYPDIASAKACVSCHNGHKDTPKKDFKLDDVMGGVAIRIAVD